MGHASEGDDLAARTDNRRDVLKKAGLGAAVAWTLPSVLSLSSPAAAGSVGPPPPVPATLVAVTGNPGGSLFTIDLATGAATPAGAISGGSGQGLASSGSLLYHFTAGSQSGPVTSVETTPFPALATAGFPLSGPALSVITNGATYNLGTLYASQWSGANLGPSNLFSIDATTGAVTSIGQISNGIQTWGLAFVGTTLYGASGAALGNGRIYPINPLTAAAGAAVAITVGGNPAPGAYALATSPTTGILYAALGNAGTPADLYEIDPLTGVATLVGATGQRIADMAFI